MREGKLATFLSGALTLLSANAYAGSAPKELYGKSIIVSWSEHRSQRNLGQPNFRDINVPLSHTIYISATGRFFDRFAATSGGGEAAHETIGANTTSIGDGPKQIQFRGRTMTLTASSKGGLARRSSLQFNEGFTACEAHIVFAKQAGSNIVAAINLSRQQMEIRSVTISGVTCSVRDGNVFAQ
jgi:hypothetical protein